MGQRGLTRELSRYPLGADITNVATSLTVGPLMSGVAVDTDSLPFYAAIEDGTANYESVLVTAISGSTWTIVRGQEGSSGVAHSKDASIQVGFTAAEEQRLFGADTILLGPLVISGAQTTGVKAAPQWIAPFACRLVGAIAMLNTAPVGAAFLISLQKNGSDVLTGVTIADGANAGTFKDAGAGTAFAQGDRLRLNIAQIGSGTAGSDLAVVPVVERT